MMSYEQYKYKVLKKEERLFSKYLIRPLSTHLSWLILRAFPSVTPNQITVLGFFIGLIGSSILSLARNSADVLIASLILYFWCILDGVDGEIARFKEMKTPTGFFLEITFDYVIIAIIPLGTAFYLYRYFARLEVLILGFTDSLSLLFYEFVIANYYWTFFKFNTHHSNLELELTESQIARRFGRMFVNRYTILIGKVIARIGSIFIYSGYMVLMLIIFTTVDAFFNQEIILWNEKITILHVFLLPYPLLIPVSIYLIIFSYISLKTKLC
jgi:phosphatidylglycerophosphate synthase